MHAKRAFAALGIASCLGVANSTAIVSSPGDIAAIPSWDLQSTAAAGTKLNALSQVGLDTSSWHHVATSKCTLMGCLVEAGAYNEDELFYSENLRKVDAKQFLVPWIYRSEFTLEPGPGQHFFLQTHGISSRADIFLNGQQVATSAEQAGSYVGRAYDITRLVNKTNALAIQVYPTDYYHDFAIGWVDWNPWPADNGTGVWRDIEIKQTGAVMLEPLRVVTSLGTPIDTAPATVTLKARAHNLESTPITVIAAGRITPPGGSTDAPIAWKETFTLATLSVTDIALTATIPRPSLWWPAQWGDQPLYTGSITVLSHTPASAHPTPLNHATTPFGLRTITTTLSPVHNDTTFHLNSRPLQILGAGYSPPLFLRAGSSPSHWLPTLEYTLSLGLNTLRLEGKTEHPALYTLASRMGVLLLPGWECCDKWEAWEYNPDLAVSPTPVWSEADHKIAGDSMAHEAGMMQPYPAVAGFLIGSDFWPDERATTGYLSALRGVDWQTPVVGSASRRGWSAQTGPGGMKMDGPYEWVPPGYWWDTEGEDGNGAGRLGAAFGFGSELGAGVGTPELGSLRRFLGEGELQDLWRQPGKKLFHLSRETSPFSDRAVYNQGLWKRWGAPVSLEDYLIKAQLMDYEATRSQFDAYTAMWSAERPATGAIYWMLNNAWPGLHWNLWDYYMRPAGSFFGAKAGLRVENVVFDYVRKAVWLVNRSLDKQGPRKLEVQVLAPDGKVVHTQTTASTTTPNTSKNILSLGGALANANGVVFIRLVLSDAEGKVLSRNVYWVAKELDVLDWGNSSWYHTPVTKYSDFTALNQLALAHVAVDAVRVGQHEVAVTLENKSGVPAFFISLNLVDHEGKDVLPLTWEDNYVTLWPNEKMTLKAKAVGTGKWEPANVQVAGKNVEKRSVKLLTP